MGRLHARSLPSPSFLLSPPKRRSDGGGGSLALGRRETHDGANKPPGLHFVFKAVINQTGSSQLPIQSYRHRKNTLYDSLMTILK